MWVLGVWVGLEREEVSHDHVQLLRPRALVLEVLDLGPVTPSLGSRPGGQSQAFIGEKGWGPRERTGLSTTRPARAPFPTALPAQGALRPVTPSPASHPVSREPALSARSAPSAASAAVTCHRQGRGTVNPGPSAATHICQGFALCS